MTSGPGMPIWLNLFVIYSLQCQKNLQVIYIMLLSIKILSDESGSFIQKGKVYSIPFQIDSHTKSKLLERIKV